MREGDSGLEGEVVAEGEIAVVLIPARPQDLVPLKERFQSRHKVQQSK